MGLSIIKSIPSGEGQLIEVSNLPITVIPNESFHAAKAALAEIVEQAGGLVNSVKTDDEYNLGISLIGQLRKFKKAVEAGITPAKNDLNAAKSELMNFIHELDEPATKIEKALAQETGRYFLWKEEQRRQEEQRQREAAERERQRLQREADLGMLRSEIAAAELEVAAARGRIQHETANEINLTLKRFIALDSTPGAFSSPIQDANSIRQAVALAKAHEEGRIAAARAREEGRKAEAARIAKASAKLEAPVVPPVIAMQVEAAPVVVAKADLSKAKGQYTKTVYRVKRICDPMRVPREFLVVSESLLNEYAKRLGANASVPGVEFEPETKTAGIRS